MTAIRVGLIGCGAIGGYIARHLEGHGGFELARIFDLKRKKCTELKKKLKKSKPAVARGIDEMFDCDLIVEAASQEALRSYALDVLDHADLMLMSVGALRDAALLDEIAKKSKVRGRKVYIPSGAIAGLDGIKAAKLGRIEKVVLTTRKPPAGLEGAPGVALKGVSLRSIRKPTVIFEGTAGEAARLFPRNVNVSVSLSIAGLGTEKTMVRIIADPFTESNVHEIELEGTFGRMRLKTENVPSPKNPRTSYLAALSAAATLDGIAGSVKLGT